MAINSEAVCLVVFPLSIIHVSVSMDEPAFSISFVILPPAFVHGSVWPNLSAFTLANVPVGDPFSVVFGVIFQFNHGSVLHGLILSVWLFVIVELSQFFSDLLQFNSKSVK